MALNRGQRNLLLLGIVFFAPMIVAYIVINNMRGTEGFATKNHGDLVSPARPLKDIMLLDEGNNSFSLSSLHGKWVVVYLGTSTCSEKCKTNLYNMRQARLGQKGEHARIERVYISLEGKVQDLSEALKKDHLGMHFISAGSTSASDLLQEFATSLDEVKANKFGLYIIDPHGNLIMRYPDGYTAKGLAKDLELLLKASQIG